jgi:hypothetical protein
MIEKFYAAHIKTMLDASAINVRKGTIQRERKNREGGDQDTIRTDRQGRKGGRNETPSSEGSRKPAIYRLIKEFSFFGCRARFGVSIRSPARVWRNW